MLEVVYGIYVYGMTNVARGSVRAGARSWDHIGLGHKVSYYLTYVKTCSEHYFNSEDFLVLLQPGFPSPVQNNTYITLIVMDSVIMFARWRLCMSSMLLLPIRM